MPLGGILGQFWGQVENAQQNQQAVNQQAGANLQANGALQANVNDAFAAAQQLMGVPRHNMIIEADPFWGAQWRPMEQIRPMRPLPRRDIFDSLNMIANDFIMNGMDFTEIVVPKSTYAKLWALGFLAQPNNSDLVMHTAMGPVKFVCEEKRGFNLDKYMETVD